MERVFDIEPAVDDIELFIIQFLDVPFFECYLIGSVWETLLLDSNSLLDTLSPNINSFRFTFPTL